MMLKSLLISLLFLCLHSVQAQEVSTLLNDPSREFAAMHWHEDGRIYAVDYFNGRLYQVYLDGTVETLVSGFSNLAGGGFDNAGNFYFARINEGIIYRLNADNSYVPVGSGFNQPVGILADPNDDDLLYITEFGNSKVSKLSISTGVKTPFVTGNGINGPDAIIFDWNGDLMISNWNNHKIHTIDADGNVSLFATIPESGMMGYVDRIGDYLYVPSFSARKIYRIDQAGEVTLIAGTGATGYEDGEGLMASFTRPNGTCHSPSGDVLLVSDDHAIRMIRGMAPDVVPIQEVLELADARISPNPAQDILTMQLRSSTNQLLHWSLFDQQYRPLRSGQIHLLSNEPNQLEVAIQDLAAGNYIIQLRAASKSRSAVFPFVKASH